LLKNKFQILKSTSFSQKIQRGYENLVHFINFVELEAFNVKEKPKILSEVPE
jgi:hypothetical protein